MRKLILAIIAACALVIFLWFFFGYPKYQDMRLRKKLFTRSDYPQIAAACVKLANSVTNDGTPLLPSDPVVPPILRSLKPREIMYYSNYVRLDFGGEGRYTYDVQQSDTNPKLWTLDIGSPEQFGSQSLTTITNN